MQLPPSRATVALVGITVAAWALVAALGRSDYAAVAGGFIPARFSGLDLSGAVPAWATPLTATLLHAGLIHIGFNMLMLGFCGRYVELAIGPRGLLILYVVGAYAAALAQYLVNPGDGTPMIGASGATSAVLGAYALFYGRRRAAVDHPGLSMALHVLWLAAAWIGVQLLVGIATARDGIAIAVPAHIGGFIAGLALARPLILWRYRKA